MEARAGGWQPVGNGSQANVYNATINGHEVAIKLPRQEIDVKALVTESRLLRQFNHPHIVNGIFRAPGMTQIFSSWILPKPPTTPLASSLNH